MGWLSKLFNLDLATDDARHAGARPQSGSASKHDACNRLKLVLMHDRTRLSPGTLEKMRDELVEVISRYVEIDKQALELNLESESNTIALVANIPLRSRETDDSPSPGSGAGRSAAPPRRTLRV